MWISTEIYGTRNVVHQTVRIGILMFLVSLPKKSDAVYHILCPVCGSGVFNQTIINTTTLIRLFVVNAEIKAPTDNNNSKLLCCFCCCVLLVLLMLPQNKYTILTNRIDLFPSEHTLRGITEYMVNCLLITELKSGLRTSYMLN